MNPLDSANILLTKRGDTWLSNFNPAHRETARWLVEGLTLVSLSYFSRTVHRLVEKEANSCDGPVALFAIREVDKGVSYFQQAAVASPLSNSVNALTEGADIGSEGHIVSILRQIVTSNPTTFLNHPTVAEMRRRECRTIIVVDDLIGSGHRARKFIDAIWLDRTIRSWWSLGYISIRVIAFSSTMRGERNVTKAKCTPAVIVEQVCPTYPELPWPKHKRDSVEELCKTYGHRTLKPNMAMGYKKLMVSMVFEHGCPNNAPSILWARPARNKTWKPLFPQRSVLEETQSVFPPEIVRRDPISVLIDAGQNRLARTGLSQMGNIASIQAFTFLALLAKGRRRNEALTFASGLSNHEVERLLDKYIAWGLVTPSRRITKSGLEELEHARRLFSKKLDVAPLGEESYYPRKLREATVS